MRNIWEIIKEDFRRVRTNVIAMVVIMGITVVPCLYAWFNIAASWDPYGSTSGLKVAVATTDQGYEGNLVQVNINLGDQVISALHENSQLDWVFTSKKKALNGVKSGKYYAAIIIPEDFSENMMSVFSDDVTKPEIAYYSNDKENAIAPKVTVKGATAIQKQVNEIFISTVTDAALTGLQTLSTAADQTGTETIVSNLSTNLNQIAADLSSASGTLSAFSGMTSSAKQLLDTTSDFLAQSQKQSKKDLKAMKKSKKSLSGVKKTISGATDGVNDALSSGASFYEEVSDLVDEAFASQSKDAGKAADTLDTLSEKIAKTAAAYSSLKDSVDAIGEAHPELAEASGKVSAKLAESAATQNELSESLAADADDLRNAAENITTSKSDIDTLISDSADSISSVQSDYENNLKSGLDSLSGSLSTVGTDVSSLLSDLDSGVDDIKDTADTASGDLADIQSALDSSCKLLNKSSKKIKKTAKKLSKMKDSGDFSELETLLSGDKESITSFVSSPVTLKEHEVYAVENYGSSMAPFYSTLSIWVGGIVLVAMLKVTISEDSLKRLHKVKNYQIYLGRYAIFLVVGLLQTTLICLGDLFYLGIQCKHPFLFLLAGWVSSIVYVNMIYTLTVSFGDIGKAIAVILLVMQVAGTGGTFPIEVAPAFFRAVYPLLPFTHSMTALREAVGGLYGMTYWASLGKLSIFLILSLFLGLVLRNPIIRLNDAFTEKLEDTHLI